MAKVDNLLYRPRDWVNGAANPFGKLTHSSEMARTIMRTVSIHVLFMLHMVFTDVLLFICRY